MSWFKRRPRTKEPIRQVPHHNFSPMTEKILEETKKQVRKKSDSQDSR